MKFISYILLFSYFLANSQTEIILPEKPYSENFHGITMINSSPSSLDDFFYDKKDKKIKYTWSDLKINSTNFKSLLVHKNSITVQFNKKGTSLIELNTTDMDNETLAFVFNDTIYQTQRIRGAIKNGKFDIKNITKKDIDKIVFTLTNLPPYDLQRKLYSSINSHKLTEIDSLLAKGAKLIDGGYKVGSNNFRNVIYNIFRDKNSKYEKYPKTINHLLKRGFVPNPKNLQQAIVFEDTTYVKRFFMAEKNIGKRKKIMKKHVQDIIANGSLELLKLVEKLGLNIENLTWGRAKTSILLKAILNSKDDEIIDYLLKKDISYDSASILVCTAIYRRITTVDVLLKNGIDINSRFDDNTNIAQSLLDLEFKHDYFMDNISLTRIPQLIERGLDVNTINGYKKTILHTLARYIKAYLSFRRGVNATYDPGEVYKDIVNLVQLIKEKGVDTKIKDNNGFTAYDYVLKDVQKFELNDNNKIQELLNLLK